MPEGYNINPNRLQRKDLMCDGLKRMTMLTPSKSMPRDPQISMTDRLCLLIDPENTDNYV